jgi:hypothetical protein
MVYDSGTAQLMDRIMAKFKDAFSHKRWCIYLYYSIEVTI